MSGQKLRLLKLNQSIDEMITARIEGLDNIICESGEDHHVTECISMIINHVTRNYTGLYVEHMCMNLIQASYWWRETYEPDLTLNIDEEIE